MRDPVDIDFDRWSREIERREDEEERLLQAMIDGTDIEMAGDMGESYEGDMR